MSWSYNPQDLKTSTRDQVRWFIGDTDIAQQQLQDEEIDFALSWRTNVFGATAMCALALKGKYSRLVSMSADGVSVQNSQKAQAYGLLAQEYIDKEALYYAVPYAGGTSIADMQTQLLNTDRVPAIFKFGMFDNPVSDGISPVSPASAADDAGDDTTIAVLG